MNDPKFVVWGTGIMGKAAAVFLGNERIRAFIDQNPVYQGLSYEGCPVISFSDYIKSYRNCHIIVSPRDHRSICALLNENNIDSYSILDEIIY